MNDRRPEFATADLSRDGHRPEPVAIARDQRGRPPPLGRGEAGLPAGVRGVAVPGPPEAPGGSGGPERPDELPLGPGAAAPQERDRGLLRPSLRPRREARADHGRAGEQAAPLRAAAGARRRTGPADPVLGELRATGRDAESP